MEEQRNNPAFPLGETPEIRTLIYTVRGVQVMLDSDLAMLFGVETKRINEAVSRNSRRFPAEFCFTLSPAELARLRSQIATSNKTARGGRRSSPRVFTEQGVSMLSAILSSPTAIEVSIRIMNSFVEMRRFIAGNATLFEQIRAVELRQLEYQRTTEERFELVFDFMETHAAPRQKIFFDGQIWDAFELLVSLVQRAKEQITLIDGYVDARTLNIIAKKGPGVDVIVWTRADTPLSQEDVNVFNAQYPSLRVRHTSVFHDRFLILDDAEGYLVGASLKDAGKKSFAVTRLEDEAMVHAILKHLGE